MADIGIKMTKPEKKATSANEYDYNLWSKYPVGKISVEGNGSGDSQTTIDYSGSAGSNSVWIPYVSADNGDWYVGGLSNGLSRWAWSAQDVQNFIFELGGDGTYYYKYFVLEDAWKS